MSTRNVDKNKEALNLIVPLKFLSFSSLLILLSHFAQKHVWQGFELMILSPLVYLMTEALGAFAQIFFSFRGFFVSPLHHNPLISQNLSEFWGHRWNTWIQDWQREVTRKLGSRNLKHKILVSFFISGLFHELMFNLPVWLYSKENYFGTMMVYFIIQGFGLWVEKVYLRHSPSWLQRIFMWLIIVVPSSLLLKGSILKLLGISYG